MARKDAPARSAPSGPGRFSKRDEKVQPIREPDIDNPDLQYGDRQRLTSAQKVARLPAGATPPPRGAQATPVGPQTAGGGGLPPFVFDSASAFPDQPVTAGLDMGPGPGAEILQTPAPAPDIREQVLQYLGSGFYGGPPNAEAQQALAQLRNERARAMMPPLQPAPALQPPGSPAAATPLPEPGPPGNRAGIEQPPPERALG